MVVILTIAAAFRFVAIGDAPPGWRDDELIEFDMDRRIVAGWRPLFIGEAEGHEPFYHYLHAGTIALFGENIIGYKWLPFAFGCLSVALTFSVARRMFDRRAALLAAGLMAVSFWPIMYARLGLRHIGILPFMLGTFGLLYPIPFTAENAEDTHRSTRRKLGDLRGLGGILIAGLLLAAALMTYFAGRALPLILIGFLAYLFIFNRSVLRQAGPGIVGAIVIGALLSAPMFAEIARTPGAEKRTEVVGGPLIAALRGDLRPVLETALGTLGMFTFAGDPESLYNLPGRPVFDWLTGAAFYLGALLCVVRLKQIGAGFALVWLVVGIAPAFVSLPAASFSHTLAALPVAYIVAADGATQIGMWASDKVTRWQGRKALALLPFYFVSVSLVLLSSLLTIRDYFGAWANDPFVRFQYHGPTRDLAGWLDRHPEVQSAAIGTHPNELYLDPLALQLDLARKDVKARWFNPQTALVLPSEGVVAISAMQPPDPEIKDKIGGLSSGPVQTVSTPAGFIAVDVYPVPRVMDLAKTEVAFDGSMGLLRRQILFGAIHPGSQVAQWTDWQVLASISDPRLKLFTHVLDGKNNVVAGDDRGDVNAVTLLPGDLIFQRSRFTLPADLAPGRYQIEIGWYHPETGERLLLPDGSDRLLLDPIEVTAP